MSVYKAINAVQAELAKTGISKDRTNTQGSGYKFRGIDDVYNSVSPLLAKHGLCILPRVLTRNCAERQSKQGGALFYITVEVEFDFVSSEDGSKHTVKTFGEAMDSGDKATNKAMSAAYKYAVFMAFSIPTEADNDADLHTHEVETPRLSSEQISEIAALVSETDTDIAALLKWVSRNVGKEIHALNQAPADAFNPILKQLKKKVVPA
jgi:hypothetical protein